MRYLPAFLLPVVAIIASPLIVVLSAKAPDSAPVLVIAPWGAATETQIVLAGGQLVGPLRAPLAALARSDNPDFGAALRLAGAWAVIDGGRIAALCGAES